MDEIVSMDAKGRLVLPKRVRTEAAIDYKHQLLVRATGVGRVELLDPRVLMSRAQEIGAKKLTGWRGRTRSDRLHPKICEEKVRMAP